MSNDLPLSSVVIAVVATYLLHSTVFLVGAWLLLAISRIQSAAFQERVWKVAAIAPLLTAPLQFAGAERFNATSVWTLPATSLTALLDSPPGPQDRPGQPLAVSRPSNFAPLSAIDSPPSQADHTALVEIIPDPSPPDELAIDPLPTIEPATDEAEVIPVVIEPAPLAAPVEFPAATIEPTDAQVEAVVPIANEEPPLQAVTTRIDAAPAFEPINDWSLRVSAGVIAVSSWD